MKKVHTINHEVSIWPVSKEKKEEKPSFFKDFHKKDFSGRIYFNSKFLKEIDNLVVNHEKLQCAARTKIINDILNVQLWLSPHDSLNLSDAIHQELHNLFDNFPSEFLCIEWKPNQFNEKSLRE